MTQAALPAMLRERFGRIVNISSIWGMTGASCEVLYSLGKGAVNSFTKALAKELAPNGITVNAVAPGAIQGGMMSRFSPEEVSMLASEIPAGRLGTPEEVAAVARFLLSAGRLRDRADHQSERRLVRIENRAYFSLLVGTLPM